MTDWNFDEPPEPLFELDLRADRCPMTFLKTKLALEPLQPGSVVRVLLRDPESIKSVPTSLEAEGCDVFAETLLDGDFGFSVQKTKLVSW